MGAVDTPYEDRIVWRDTPQGGEGQSRLGRYVHTRHRDGTFDVEFIGREGRGAHRAADERHRGVQRERRAQQEIAGHPRRRERPHGRQTAKGCPGLSEMPHDPPG